MTDTDPDSQVTPLEVIERAREIIAEGWCQGHMAEYVYVEDDVEHADGGHRIGFPNPMSDAKVAAVCALGGIDRAVYQLTQPWAEVVHENRPARVPPDGAMKVRQQATSFVERALGLTPKLKRRRSITAWNGRHTRRKEQVLKHFDDVAEQLRARGDIAESSRA